MFTNKYKRVECSAIKVARDERHRKTIEVGDLLESIRLRGVMNPIIVDDELNLIAGERRLTASIALKLPDIPVRFVSDLSPIERQIIELEENVKRKDLTWQEASEAVRRIHSLYRSLDPEWSQQKTADALGYTKGTTSLYLQVGEAIAEGNGKLAKAQTVRQAHNVLSRASARRDADLIEDLTSSIAKLDRPAAPLIEGILTEDFLSWAPSYDGPPFNFLHCDFPYGINMQDSDQGNSEMWGEYQDDPDTYWSLLSCLSQHQNTLLSSSAHMMFWFSMSFYQTTLEFFSQQMPEWEMNLFPLVWVKSDNRGILPDPKRGPRRIYETCLFGSRGDRLVVKATSNAYHSPAGTKLHQSEKPEPMLRYFFEMFVDEQTRMLDPTCGAGSSLRAAETLKAPHVLGLEKNPEFAEVARRELQKSRTLRSLTR